MNYNYFFNLRKNTNSFFVIGMSAGHNPLVALLADYERFYFYTEYTLTQP